MKWPKKSTWRQIYWKALEEENIEKIQRLIDKGLIKIQTKNLNQETPLQWAAKNEKKDVFMLLLKNGAKDNVFSPKTALFFAFSSGRKDFIDALFKSEALPKKLDNKGGVSDQGVNDDNILHAAFSSLTHEFWPELFKKIKFADAFRLIQNKTREGYLPEDFLLRNNNLDQTRFYCDFLMNCPKKQEDVLIANKILANFFVKSVCSLKSFEVCAQTIPRIELNGLKKLIMLSNIEKNTNSSKFIEILAREDFFSFSASDDIDSFLAHFQKKPEFLKTLLTEYWKITPNFTQPEWDTLSKNNPELFSFFEKQKLDLDIEKRAGTNIKKEMKRL